MNERNKQKRLILNTVLTNYGSINSFVDDHYGELGMSRTHMYALINYRVENPGVKTLGHLAELLGLPKEDVINDYLAGYRDGWPSD